MPILDAFDIIPPKTIHVAVAVIRDANDRILLAKRPLHSSQGGWWEFPGGKVQVDEPVPMALRREIDEEVGLHIEQARPLIRIHHTYPNKIILLDVWTVEKWSGEAYGKEGQEIQWCTMPMLQSKELLTANAPIVTALQLPDLYLITPEPYDFKRRDFFYRLTACVDHGLKLVQLRSKRLNELEYGRYAEQAMHICQNYHAQLFLNATPQLAAAVGTDGVHLTSAQLLACTERPHGLRVAASCHNTAEVTQANDLKIEFITIGHLRPTPSHPDLPPLTWKNFFELTELAHCPTFAIGGLTLADMPCALANGAQGIAAIRGLFGQITA